MIRDGIPLTSLCCSAKITCGSNEALDPNVTKKTKQSVRQEKTRLEITGVSKTQTSKRKRKDELRDLYSLRSRAKAVFVFVPRLCFLGLCLQGLRFRGLHFRVLEKADNMRVLRVVHIGSICFLKAVHF